MCIDIPKYRGYCNTSFNVWPVSTSNDLGYSIILEQGNIVVLGSHDRKWVLRLLRDSITAEYAQNRGQAAPQYNIPVMVWLTFRIGTSLLKYIEIL